MVMKANRPVNMMERCLWSIRENIEPLPAPACPEVAVLDEEVGAIPEIERTWRAAQAAVGYLPMGGR